MNEELYMFKNLCAVIRENRRLTESNRELQATIDILKNRLISSKNTSEVAQVEVDRIQTILPKLRAEIEAIPIKLKELEEDLQRRRQGYDAGQSHKAQMNFLKQRVADKTSTLQDLEKKVKRLPKVAAPKVDITIINNNYHEYY